MAAGLSIGLFMICSLLVVGVKAEDLKTGPHRRLFVFGDSFADTGNVQHPAGPYYALGKPYGETYPGFPTGRWSDGKVMTDFVAAYMHLPSPVPYRKREQFKRFQRYGMNFAYAGSGVFDTFNGQPTMTQQIDAFEQLINSGVYANHLNSSIALVSYAGNDYAVYLDSHNFSTEGLYAYGKKVVRQLAANVKRLHHLGVKKVAVTNLQPAQCSPGYTYLTSFARCASLENPSALTHNQLLNASLHALSPPVIILDNYNAFLTVLQQEKFGNRLKPCCMGVNNTVWCGAVDGSTGQPQYTVCPNISSTFWWDGSHPSHFAWKAVVQYHHPSLHQLLA